MDTLIEKALKLEEGIYSTPETGIPYASYGRGVEHASALGLWFVAYTLFTSDLYVIGGEFLELNTFLWGYLAAVLGICQMVYSRIAQRLIFTIFASVFWLSLSVYCFIEVGNQWSIATAACLPFSIFNFYIYGFVYNTWLANRS